MKKALYVERLSVRGRSLLNLRVVLAALMTFALISGVNLAVAQSSGLQGSFVEYSIHTKSQTHQTDGTIRQEVAQDYGNGRVRLKTAGNFSDTRFTLERNVSANHVFFPVLHGLGAGFTFTISRNSVSVTITANLVGTEEVAFQGSTHKVNVTSFSAVLNYSKGSVMSSTSIRGAVRTFASGLLYSFEASHEPYPQNGTITTTLITTNLPLDTPILASSLTSGYVISSILGGREESTQSQNSTGIPSPTTQFTLVALLATIAIVGVLLYITFGRRIRKKPEPQQVAERPPHWVQS